MTDAALRVQALQLAIQAANGQRFDYHSVIAAASSFLKFLDPPATLAAPVDLAPPAAVGSVLGLGA